MRALNASLVCILAPLPCKTTQNMLRYHYELGNEMIFFRGMHLKLANMNWNNNCKNWM